MKIIENKKDKVTVAVSIVFVALYAVGTVFAGTLLKEDTTTDTVLVVPQAVTKTPIVESGSTVPAQATVESTAISGDITKNQNQQSKPNNEDDDRDDD